MSQVVSLKGNQLELASDSLRMLGVAENGSVRVEVRSGAVVVRPVERDATDVPSLVDILRLPSGALRQAAEGPEEVGDFDGTGID